MDLIDIIKPLSTVLSRAVNKSLQQRIIGNAENQTQGHWVQSENAIYCAMRPLPPNFVQVCLTKLAALFLSSFCLIELTPFSFKAEE